MRNIALIALLSLAAPAYASGLGTDTVLGTSMDEVRASLTEMGYEIRKAEMEDGRIEVYFVKDGKMGEAYVDVQTGKIVKVEMK
jgi:hypothetical protein